ncbi:hypothetical protein GGTG_11471 [Gaeumannomyces tritici R3-111a-1]|uniref:Uncharacterized protein n=1 Tax=Gaeumannomyces tritici (strain R3-111a-1) TaxID=644352 RepID=J3PDA3_GAET3|nr:hypothetical protein GGTG_11471 [Gaeumannomyces tritici R3-111a-1]EJT70448.1 hypothetical protein GGTG_11471 [Gaeumannomyces tritici R3-111a-1]
MQGHISLPPFRDVGSAASKSGITPSHSILARLAPPPLGSPTKRTLRHFRWHLLLLRYVTKLFPDSRRGHRSCMRSSSSSSSSSNMQFSRPAWAMMVPTYAGPAEVVTARACFRQGISGHQQTAQNNKDSFVIEQHDGESLRSGSLSCPTIPGGVWMDSLTPPHDTVGPLRHWRVDGQPGQPVSSVPAPPSQRKVARGRAVGCGEGRRRGGDGRILGSTTAAAQGEGGRALLRALSIGLRGRRPLSFQEAKVAAQKAPRKHLGNEECLEKDNRESMVNNCMELEQQVKVTLPLFAVTDTEQYLLTATTSHRNTTVSHGKRAKLM